VAITIGDALLPFLNDLVQQARPVIEELGKRLPAAIEAVIAKVKELIGAFQAGGVVGLAGALGFSDETIATMQAVGQRIAEVIQFVMDHWEAFRGALIGIGAVLAAAAIAATIAGIAAAIAALANPITLIIGVAALLGAAWSENWFGIRDILTDFWQNTAQPILSQLIQWLKIYVPVAVQAAAELWQTVLLPALRAVGDFIGTVVIPVLQTLLTWLAETIPPVIQALADYWTNVLLPSLRQIWAFIQEYIIPILDALASVWIAFLKLELKILAGIWQNVLLPALRAVWDFITGSLIPIFKSLVDFISQQVGPKVKWLTGLAEKLEGAFKKVKDVLKGVVDRLKELARKINELGDKLPDWMTPGSPTPLELGLRGINDAMRQLSRVEVPRMSAALQMAAPVGMLAGPVSNTTTNFNMTVNTGASPAGVVQQYEVMRALVG
jgi:phage-related protein